MGKDFKSTCQVETRKALWLVGLVLASVLIIQYFELPYRNNSMISSLSSADRDVDFKGKQSYDRNDSSPSVLKMNEGSISPENFVIQNDMEMNRTLEVEPVERSISIAPENAVSYISPASSVNTTEGEIAASNRLSAYAPAALDESSDTRDKVSIENVVADISPSPSVGFIGDKTVLTSAENSRIAPSPTSLGVSLAPVVSPSQSVLTGDMDLNIGAPSVAFSPPTIADENRTSSNSNSEVSKNESSSTTNSPPPKQKPEKPRASVVTISEMNEMLLQSRGSSFSKNPLWPSAADRDLLDARFQIENAAIIRDYPGLYAPVYRNLTTFVRSYEIMEQKLKVYIYNYNDRKRAVFHQPRLTGIYASEGWFMKLLEASDRFLTSNAEEAHLFYLPFSSQKLVDYVYVPNSHSFHGIIEYLKNYHDMIKGRYPFWNRTDGGDHFLVACHDWAPYETKHHMLSTIRALCNADVKEGFQLGKDVSLPETFVHSAQNPMKEVGGNPPSNRKILAFFAGQMHGYVRPILLQYWENKDPDMKIFGKMHKGYVWHMKNSKYCICAKGYEVNSPRVVEAILYGCVPVIISDNFVPPFFDILNWETFAVFILEKDIPNLKNILVSISDRRYAVMQLRVKRVRQHFVWHNVPVKYDVFHMILHSVWYNRVLRLSPI